MSDCVCSAFTDALTDLPNMSYFRSIAKDNLLKWLEEGKSVCVIYFDIENIKIVNDRFGHKKGDELLVFTANTISKRFAGDIAARIADDHFAVMTLINGIEDKINVIQKAVAEFFEDFHIELKAGIYVFSEDDSSISKACDRAKIACDSIKRRYDVGFKFYDKAMSERLMRSRIITESLDSAIKYGHIKPFYQPVVRTVSNTLCGVEALSRWIDDRPDGLGFLSPGEFIPVLEDARLIHKLDLCILDRVCHDIHQMEIMDGGSVPVSINLSRLDFELCDIFAEVDAIRQKYNVPIKLLHMEVTESAFSDENATFAKHIERFRQAGYQIWMDDFGSGYSSLNILKDYQFDVLKIDMKFLQTLDSNPKSKLIVTSVVDMAKQLGIQTLAEGVETKEQFIFLKMIGCDKAQGYFFSKPVPFEAASHFKEKLPQETWETMEYYDDVCKVNLLRDNPTLKGKSFTSGIPMLMIEVRNGKHSIVAANNALSTFLTLMDVSDKEGGEEYLNDPVNPQSIGFRAILQKSRITGAPVTMDYVHNDYYCTSRAVCIAEDRSTGSSMFLVSTLCLSQFSDWWKQQGEAGQGAYEEAHRKDMSVGHPQV